MALSWRAAACLACACMFVWSALPARAAAVYLEGTVVDASGAPVAAAAVTVSGANLTMTQRSDAAGRFSFTTLAVGTYRLRAVKGALSAERSVALTSAMEI